MSDEKFSIKSLGEIFAENLTIPNYQRPYRWSAESTSVLFNDIYEAMNKKQERYRVGTVILCENGENFEIVDGQQRITTLSILLYCLDWKDEKFLKNFQENLKFNDLSSNAIANNYKLLKHLCDRIKDERENFKGYLLNNCEFVKIVVKSEQEAFQFFDSQNSRGRALAPQDLLKAYHLREMADSDETQKIKIINTWENEDQKELAKFFKFHLYPLTRWYRGKDGIDYSVKKINIFKGITSKNKSYHYAIYHRTANLVDLYENMYDLSSLEKIKLFQLTQPLIAGERFFHYTHYYFNLYEKLDNEISAKYGFLEAKGSGDQYIKNLFISALIFFVDRFNKDALNDARIKFFAKWAYSLRVVMTAVYIQTINKYALGKHGGMNEGLNLFEKIAWMQNPQELDNIILENPKEETVLDKCKKDKKHKNYQIYENLWRNENEQ